MAQVSAYKTRNKIQSKDNTKYNQCQFIPRNMEKVLGDPRVLCRSSWETKFANWCDTNPQVKQWGSEIISIPYRDPASVNLDEARKYNLDITNPQLWPVRNYYPDFFVCLLENDGTEKKMLIEIKPAKECVPPAPISESAKVKEIRSFNHAARTFLTNNAKWNAAREWCKMHGMEFAIFDEHVLRKMNLL